MRLALSTQTFREQRLDAALCQHIANAGFERIELWAARGHFDSDAPAAGASLRRWLDEARLSLALVHAPSHEQGPSGWTRLPSLASADPARRQTALGAIDRVMTLRAEVPFDLLVVHPGIPNGNAAPADNSREAARRSLEHVAESSSRAGLRVALEVQTNDVGSVESLLDLIDDVDAAHVGVCFDFGHAHLSGDVVDALEMAAGHVIATHLHDNAGRRDEHLWPFEGTINWSTALMTLQKVGYEGTYVLTPAARVEPLTGPDLAVAATLCRQRLSDVLYAM